MVHGAWCFITTLHMWAQVSLYQGFFIFLEKEGRHANAKAHEALDHLTCFLSSREEILQPGIEPLPSSLKFGYLSTIIQ